MSRTTSLWTSAVRWMAMLPGAVGAAWVAHILIVLGNQWTMAPYVDPDSFLAKAFIAFMSHAALGGVAVYVACVIAPSHEAKVAAAMTALLLILAGFAVYEGISNPDSWLVFAGICLSLGACIIGYGIFSGEIRIGGAKTDRHERTSE